MARSDKRQRDAIERRAHVRNFAKFCDDISVAVNDLPLKTQAQLSSRGS